MNKRYIVALELSDSQIKGAVASVSTHTHSALAIPSIEALASEEKVNCVQYGRVQNLIDAASHVNYVIQKLENDQALSGSKITSAYVALGGRSLGSIHTTAELTLNSEMEITEDILKRLCQEATKSIPADKKVLKVLPRKYYVDNQLSQRPVGTMGTKLKGEFTVVLCHPTNRRNLEKVFDDRVKLPVRGYIVTPLALASLVLGEEEKQLGCALVDIGAQTTTVAIYKDRALQYLATLPMGSHNITRDIAIGMNITEERAEQAKIAQGNAVPDAQALSEEQARVNCYVQARAAEILANIGAQIGFAGYKPTDLRAGIILTGRGSKLRNLSQLIENQLKVRARLASIPATVNVSSQNYTPTDYASIIAIIAQSSKIGDLESCIEWHEAPHDIAIAESAQTVSTQNPAQQSGYTSSYNKGNSYSTGNNTYSDDSDDPYLLLDDDQAAKRREQEWQNQQRKREQEEEKSRRRQEELKQKDEEQKRKEEKRLLKEEKEAKEREQKEKRKREKEERNANKPSIAERLRRLLVNATTYDPTEYDTDLDDDDKQ